jgi:hypothetical protein
VGRDVWCLGGAIILHLAAAATLLRTAARPTPRSAEAAEAAAETTETEIDVAASPASPAPRQETEALPPSPTPPAETAGVTTTATTTATANGNPNGDPPRAGASPSSSAAAGAQVFALSPADIGVGLGGTNPFLPRRDDASAQDGKQVLRDALRTRDSALGLGPEGPVLAALRDATYGSAAPANGRAVFEVHAGEGGVISLVDLVSTEGAGWADTQRIARERLASVKLVLPRGAKGAVLRVEIVSKWQLPAPSGFGTRAAEGNDGPALTFPDPANIGAKPRRVVHAQILASTVL